MRGEGRIPKFRLIIILITFFFYSTNNNIIVCGFCTNAVTKNYSPSTIQVLPCQNLIQNVGVVPKFSSKNVKLDSKVNSGVDFVEPTPSTSSSKLANDSEINTDSYKTPKASKRKMLKFAIPALGIFLSNPLLSNIDNSFVGRVAGINGLAALSPGTLCIDLILYVFSFLSRATTGLVARAYSTPNTHVNGDDTHGNTTTALIEQSKQSSSDVTNLDMINTKAAREAASAPLTIALFCGFMISIMYALVTPNLLTLLNVQPTLRPAAASYIYWRGSVSWAALGQNVALSIMLATRDAITPLKIIGTAAMINVVGDFLFCAWPLRWGCAGAAAATAIATLISSGFMLRALHKNDILPRLKIPTWKELLGLLEFTGPLLAITLTRMIGIFSMQRKAMSLGLNNLAGYQLCVNVMLFCLFFGEPLSQLSQTQLPALVDKEDGEGIMAALKSISILSISTALGVAGLSFLVLTFGSFFFTKDLSVQLLARNTAPALFLAVFQGIITTTSDGAMLASRDFGFMLSVGISTCLMQLSLLPRCTAISGIFLTFFARLAIYFIAVGARTSLGFGALGRSIRKRSSKRLVNVPKEGLSIP